MFKLAAHTVITELVDVLLPRGSGPDKGLGIQVVAELNGDAADETAPGASEITIRKYISFVFHRPSNYTKVFVNISNVALPFHVIKDWSLESDHDSCWRDDGVRSVLSKEYFAIAKHLKGAPINQHDFSRLAPSSPMLLTVKVTRTGKPDPREASTLEIVRG
jgi:hypothetical protein